MEREKRAVVGSYTNQEEALSVIRRLKEKGYMKDDITLYTNPDNVDRFKGSQDANVSTEATTDQDRTTTEMHEDDRSLWDEIKDMFSSDTYDQDTQSADLDYTEENDVLYPYKDNIMNGDTVIVVNNYRGDLDSDMTEPQTPMAEDTHEDHSMDEDLNRDKLTDEERIQLKEERLQVDKKDVQTGEVHVRKETVHDTETVEVPVEREEIVVERKPVTDGDSTTMDTDFDEDTESYTIPVKEEQVEVTKKPVVKEEVEIRKERKQDVKEVTEDVRREELEVETEGRTGSDRTDDDINLDRDLDKGLDKGLDKDLDRDIDTDLDR